MYKFVIISALLAVSLANKHKCPFSLGKYPFDEQKFAGEWNVIAATAKKLPQPPKCGKFEFVPSSEGSTFKYSGVLPNNTVITKEIYSQPIFGKLDSLAYSVVRKGDGYIGPFKRSVVATDYDTYAAVTVCRVVFNEKTKTFERDLMAGILSRTKSLGPETMSVLKNVLSGFDIEPTSILEVDHSSCN